MRVFLNLQPKNSDPKLYVIPVGQGYLYSHIVSTKFAILVIYFLLNYTISYQPIERFIMVMDFRIKFLSFLHGFKLILDSHKVHYILFSANFSRNLPF